MDSPPIVHIYCKMENILKLSEFSTVATAHEIDSEQFSIFMQRKPIWDFFSLTQDKYISKSNQEKIHLIHTYYKSMKEGKNLAFFLFLISYLRNISLFTLLKFFR